MPTATKKAPTKASAVKKTVARPSTKKAVTPARAKVGGRPRAYDEERRQIQIRLPEDLRTRVDDESARRRVSKNFLIEKMIADMLPVYEGQDLNL
jgi:hypothetical protein